MCSLRLTNKILFGGNKDYSAKRKTIAAAMEAAPQAPYENDELPVVNELNM